MEREKRSILVVDSSASSIFYVSMLLRELRYAVRSVRTGEDALSAIASSAPAVVITDAVLPTMSGVELLKQIKNNLSLRFIPVIITTADTSTASKEACTKAGCAAYFMKPVDPEALYRAIQSATEATPRQKIRINTALKARIGPGEAGGKTRIEEVTSLSEGGLYLSTSAPAPVNDLVPLTLLLRNHEIEATGVVLYSSAQAGGLHAVPGMGMKFTKISAEDVNLIRDFIRAEVMRDLEGRKA
ncbi:MAG TPA: response regulator [Nitrospirota bacterium]|nr:response regulator [Nitrospirota bacterium]